MPEPLLRRIEAHVFAADRLHGDDTTVPVLAKGKTDTGRCWVYVRDDLPFGVTALYCFEEIIEIACWNVKPTFVMAGLI